MTNQHDTLRKAWPRVYIPQVAPLCCSEMVTLLCHRSRLLQDEAI